MKIEVGNTQLNVEDRGSGSVLLLIHGFPLNLEMWRPQIEDLSNHKRVIAVDLRGHGHSPPTPGSYSMDVLADDCAAVLAALRVEDPVTVCGLSMGGYVSFALFRRHPQLISALILSATRPGSDSDLAKANREKAIAETKQHGSQPVLDKMLKILLAPDTYESKPELVKNLAEIIALTSTKGILSALAGMKDRLDSTMLLGQINIPTLVIHGAQDQIITLNESESMASGVKNSRLEIIPVAGHLPNLEQPEMFNSIVSDFLASI